MSHLFSLEIPKTVLENSSVVGKQCVSVEPFLFFCFLGFFCLRQRVVCIPSSMHLCSSFLCFLTMFLKNHCNVFCFSDDLVELSKAKYSRNVVKKFLMYG